MEPVEKNTISHEMYGKMAEGRHFAVSSYFWLFSVFPLLFRSSNPFVRQHARQGITLSLWQNTAILLWLILLRVPVIHALLFTPRIRQICRLAFIFFSLYFILAGTIKVLNGENYDLPGLNIVPEKINNRTLYLSLLLLSIINIIMWHIDQLILFIKQLLT